MNKHAALFGVLFLLLPACGTIFPPRDEADTGGSTYVPPTGGGEAQVYPYQEGCNCAQGYSCDGASGCQQYICFASTGTWWEAHANCALQGMQLLVPVDEDQSDFLVSVCEEAGAEEWWIGLQDIASDGQYFVESSTGAYAPTFLNWDEGAPAAGPGDDCVVQDVDGVWHDTACMARFAYVCATPATYMQTRGLGAACSTPGSSSGDCGTGLACYTTSETSPVSVCSYPCESDDQCIEGGRCTTTPQGKLCLRRCAETTECQALAGDLRCVTTPSGDGVCWGQGARSGEVMTQPKLELDRIVFDASTGGRITPGAVNYLHVLVKNSGDGDAGQVRGTVSTSSPYVVGLTGETGALVQTIVAGQGQVEVAAPQVTLSASLPLGEPVEFLVTLTEGISSISWQVPFQITAFGSPAVVWVTRVETDAPLLPGQSTTVRLFAENVGHGSVAGVTTEVTAASATASYAGAGAYNLSFVDPLASPVPAAPQLLATGTVSVFAEHPAGAPVLLHLVTREPGGTVWEQDVEIPVGP